MTVEARRVYSTFCAVLIERYRLSSENEQVIQRTIYQVLLTATALFVEFLVALHQKSCFYFLRIQCLYHLCNMPYGLTLSLRFRELIIQGSVFRILVHNFFDL